MINIRVRYIVACIVQRFTGPFFGLRGPGPMYRLNPRLLQALIAPTMKCDLVQMNRQMNQSVYFTLSSVNVFHQVDFNVFFSEKLISVVQVCLDSSLEMYYLPQYLLRPFTSLFLLLNADVQRRESKQPFYNLWFDLTGT